MMTILIICQSPHAVHHIKHVCTHFDHTNIIYWNISMPSMTCMQRQRKLTISLGWSNHLCFLQSSFRFGFLCFQLRIFSFCIFGTITVLQFRYFQHFRLLSITFRLPHFQFHPFRLHVTPYKFPPFLLLLSPYAPFRRSNSQQRSWTIYYHR